jgi:hypothetical protein
MGERRKEMWVVRWEMWEKGDVGGEMGDGRKEKGDVGGEMGDGRKEKGDVGGEMGDVGDVRSKMWYVGSEMRVVRCEK